jgi:hypothetical protein
MRARHLLPLTLLAAADCSKAARIELEPGSLRFSGRGQAAKIHATPVTQAGQAVPDEACRWSSSDVKVAIAAPGALNEATVTSTGPGAAAIRCTIGPLVAEVPVTVRTVARIAVSPARAELKVQDDPLPVALKVEAYDDAGTMVPSRAVFVRCDDEAICRGDARGQLWAVGPGDSRAVVEIEGARAELPVHVVDARTAASRPKRVTGNPMEAIERAVRERDAKAAREARP